MRRTLIFIAVFSMALMAARGVLAEPQHKGTSTLTGVVLGPDDKPVPHASVSYQSSGGNAPHATFTNSKGRFTITKLRADNYDMRASSKGIFSEWEKNVALGRGQTKDVTLQLIYAREMPKPAKTTKPKQ
jgi:carboxypeptidase family protein